MGAPTKGASVELSSHITSCEFRSSGGKGATPSARDLALNRGNKQPGKLSRSRRLPGGATQKYCQRSPHQHWHQQQPALGPVGYPLVHRGTSLPVLAHSVHSNHDMQTTPSQVDKLGAPTESDFCPVSLRSSTHSALTKPIPQVPAPSGVDDYGSSYDSVNDQEQQVLRRGLEDLLARPPPSFDYMIPHNYGRCTQDSLMHQGGNIPASSTLPELFLSRAGRRNGGGSEVTPARDEVRGKPSQQEEQRRGSSNTAAGPSVKRTTSRRTKPTRSQSGGHLRPGKSSGAAAFRGRGSASSAGARPTKHTTAAESFEGVDALLLEEAFAFAEISAKKEEEEAAKQDNLAAREGRKLGRDGGGLGVDLQLHRGEKGGRLRRTRSSGGETVEIEMGGRAEVEDWVRGLPGSSSQGFLQRQLNRQQSTSSINQGQHHNNSSSDLSGREGREQQARARRRGKLTVGLRKKESREEAGDLRFDRRRETEGKKRATATVELVERFETGAGVSALRAELEESQAAMRRSADAFQQVASQWHQERLTR